MRNKPASKNQNPSEDNIKKCAKMARHGCKFDDLVHGPVTATVTLKQKVSFSANETVTNVKCNQRLNNMKSIHTFIVNTIVSICFAEVIRDDNM